MKFQSFSDWGKTRCVQTDPSETEFVGIAIGPNSDEGLVLVGDIPLQAGRVLPLRSKKYGIERARPLDITDTANPGPTGSKLASLRTLSLLMFEDVAELGGNYDRADGVYDATNIVIAGNATTLALAVPFVGRREALFVVTSETIGANPFSYSVKGARYMRSSGEIERYVLHADANATLSADETLAFYVGGNDNAEKWDQLELYISTTGTWAIDADTIGELGH